VGFTAGGAGLFAASSVLLVADGGAVFDWFVFGFAYLSALSSGHATPDANTVRDFQRVFKAVLFDWAGVANVFGVVGGFASFREPESCGVVSARCVSHPFCWWRDEGCEVVNGHLVFVVVVG
jgi:hypothetical protein